MRIGETFRGLPRIPVRHIILAFVCGTAVLTAFGVWSRSLATEYMKSALLSYDTPHRFLVTGTPPQSEDSTVQIAESILSPQLLKRIQVDSQFPSGAGGTNADEFRMHMELTQPAPGLLQLTYRGENEKQVAAATDLLSNALASWISEADVTPVPAAVKPAKDRTAVTAAPALPATRPTPPSNIVLPSSEARPALNTAQMAHRIAALKEDSATLALQQREIEHQISELNQHRRGITSSGAEVQAEPEQTHPMSINHDLAKLRDVRAELIAQQQANRAMMEKLEEQAIETDQIPSPAKLSSQPSAPQPAPIPVPPATGSPAPQQTAVSAAKHPIVRGSFSVIEGGGKPHPVGNEEKLRILTLGTLAAILSTAIYLLLAGWRFRPVTDLDSLHHAIPRDARYFGAVAGSPLTEKTS